MIQTGKIMILEVPKDATGVTLSLLGHNLLYNPNPDTTPYGSYRHRREIKLPDGKWKILGRPLELADEAKKLVLWNVDGISGRDFVHIVSNNKVNSKYSSFLEFNKIDDNHIIILDAT